MKLKTLHMALAAGSLAVVVSGCGTIDRMTGTHLSDRNTSADRSSDRAGSADRAAGSSSMGSSTAGSSSMGSSASGSSASAGGMASDRSGYAGGSASRGTTPSIDPFAPGYVPFPASENESAGILGQSAFCRQHYNQPGCQTSEGSPLDRGQRYNRGGRS
jgi:hypothetical protein